MKIRKLIIILGGLLFALPGLAKSPRSMLWEFRFGLYKPDIDSEFTSGVHPYKDTFGDSQHLMFQTQLGYELFNKLGTVLLSPGIGYFKVSGHGFLKSGEKAKDKTTMSILPLYLDLQYRFDLLWQDFHIPIVPVIRGGVDYYVWWIKNGVGEVSTYKDKQGRSYDGKGGTFGAHVGFALHFVLDWVAPGMSQDFDADWGVNATSLFVEYTMNFINDFGSSKSFNLSSKSLFFGIAFEF